MRPQTHAELGQNYVARVDAVGDLKATGVEVDRDDDLRAITVRE
jgi:hypothetical protein